MDSSLADRVREVIGDDPNIAEIRMFGGLCFMLNGNMLVCTMKAGDLLVRVGEGGIEAAARRPGASRMKMGAREMKGYVVVDADALDEASLRQWIADATSVVGPMPPKVKKPTKTARNS